jgi:hypothetical protein
MLKITNIYFSSDTWELEETLSCPDLIKKFNKQAKSSTTKAKAKAYKSPKSKKRKYADSDDSGDEDDDSEDSDFGSKSKASRGEYEVAKVLDGKINKQGKWEFFVMWKGYGPEDNTWEPESHLSCPKLINEVI